jgi:hypothetical protein
LRGTVEDAVAKFSALGGEMEQPILEPQSHAASRQGAPNETNRHTRIRERFGLIHEYATSVASNFLAAPFGSETSTNHLVSQQERKRRRTPRAEWIPPALFTKETGSFLAVFLIGCPRDFA